MDQLVTNIRDHEWINMIQEQKASGLTIDAWCREKKISRNCFYYRQRRLRRQFMEALPQFVELNPPAAPEIQETTHLENFNSTARITIGGVSIELSNAASEELIGRIVRAVHDR